MKMSDPKIKDATLVELSALGRDLREPVASLGEWAIRNQPVIHAAREKFDRAA